MADDHATFRLSLMIYLALERVKMIRSVFVMLSVCLVCATLPQLSAAEHQGMTTAAEKAALFNAEAGYKKLVDGLAGEWTGYMVHNSEPVHATYYLTGNDSAMVEYIQRPNKPAASMSSVYHLADQYLQVTHFCSMRNQPRLRGTTLSKDGKTITFELLDVSNLSRSGNRYTHKMVITLHSPERATVTYVGLDDGYEGELTVELTRSIEG